MQTSYHQWISLVRSYRWNSLFVKYFKKIFCIVLLPFLLIAVLLTFYANTNLRHEQEGILKEYMQKNFYTLDAVFSSINHQQLMFTTNRYCSAYFSSDVLQSESLDAKIDIMHLKELLQNTALSLSYIQNVYLYNFNCDYILGTRGGNPRDSSTILPFFARYEQQKSSPLLFSENGDLWIVYEHKPYGTPLGLVVFDIDLSQIRDQLIFSGGRVTLLSSDGATLFSASDDANSSSHTIPSETELTYHSLTLCTELYTSGFSRQHLAVLLLCTLCLLLLPLLLSLYLSYTSYDSITKIITTLGGSSGADQPQNSDQPQQNELDYIQLNIKNMFTRQRELEADLAARIYQLKKAQALTLQTQFNPHFLFNTINLAIIKEASIARCDTVVTKILSLLSTLLRISLNTKRYIVTVEEELEYAKTYLEIISIRYNHNFDIEYQIAPETLKLQTVKLILQPLLENAFEHGIHHISANQRGKIVIRSYLEDERLILTVFNNGVPCPKETLEQLRKLLETETIPDAHIGLASVNSRIKLIFGSEYGCIIDSDEHGTICTITLPIKREEP